MLEGFVLMHDANDSFSLFDHLCNDLIIIGKLKLHLIVIKRIVISGLNLIFE